MSVLKIGISKVVRFISITREDDSNLSQIIFLGYIKVIFFYYDATG